MNNKTGIWILLTSLLIVVLLYISWQKFGTINVSAEILSKEEAQKLVQDRYQGTVKQIRLIKEQYDIELEKEDNLYSIRLDALSGKVIVITKKGTKSPPSEQPPVSFLSEEEIKKRILAMVKGTITSFEKINSNGKIIYKALVKEDNKQTTLTVDAVSGKILSSTTITSNGASKRLTEEEAKEIAKKQVNGAVDHVWMETNFEQTYYLVEIKTKDDREAIVQIHAITGNVMSVTWDDSSDDDNQNDDSKNRIKDDKKEDDD